MVCTGIKRARNAGRLSVIEQSGVSISINPFPLICLFKDSESRVGMSIDHRIFCSYGSHSYNYFPSSLWGSKTLATGKKQIYGLWTLGNFTRETSFKCWQCYCLYLDNRYCQNPLLWNLRAIFHSSIAGIL